MDWLPSGHWPPRPPNSGADMPDMLGDQDFCQGLANDPEVEEFAELANSTLSDFCTVATLLPWSSGTPPAGILAPDISSEDLLLKQEDIMKAVRKCSTVLIPVTFEMEEEQEQAKRIAPQFTRLDHVCIIGVILLPNGVMPEHEVNDIIIRRHDAFLESGIDDVLFEPEREDVASLKRSIILARSIWEANVVRMKLMLEAELDCEMAKQAGRLEKEHTSMLWEDIPKTLMPHFPPIDENILETGFTVGKYRLIRRMPTNKGTVLEAINEENRSSVVKVIEKSSMDGPGHLEVVHREFRLLSEIIRHPNIVRCSELVHSPSRMYLVFEFAGGQNVETMLKARSQQRMSQVEVNNCFEQVVRGVAHLHAKDIAHRAICLHHLVLTMLAGSDREHIRICDFQHAMLAKPSTTCRSLCGSMPYMSPEMALGGPHWPHTSDTWSTGVCLMEMAGGLGSLSRGANYNPEAPLPQIATTLLEYFEDPVSHADALATLGGVETITVIELLEQILVPNQAERVLLRNLLPENQPGAEQELLQHELQRLQEQQQEQQQMLQLLQRPRVEAAPPPPPQ
eukprot:TRINITY_DN51801_c0_g1_i1.p1 TRINITY_DN51801_c0_g1~~TRINITY_DN51801_c0_g1_i1.p1  ORF type:complete len:576 (-),score=137.05 TRINITY_DN51801_c0_g1_i1:41-1741(-)